MWERHTQGYALALLGWGWGADMESWTPSPAGPAPALPALVREAAGREGGVGEAKQARHPWVSQVGTPGGGAPTPLSLPPPG